jgi:hypothetical protein
VHVRCAEDRLPLQRRGQAGPARTGAALATPTRPS